MKFVVLIDVTEASARLLKFAHGIAAAAGATLLVVHQSILPTPAMGDAENRSAVKNENKNRSLEALRHYVENIIGDSVPLEYEVTTGNLQGFLHSLEKSMDFNLVFVGVKHKGLMEKMLVGNTATKLTNDLSKTIIALPEEQNGPSFDTLYVAVKKEFSFNDQALYQCITALRNTVKKVHLFSIVAAGEDENAVISLMEKIVSGVPEGITGSYETIQAADPHKQIKNFMHAHRNGILVVQKGSRGIMDVFRKYFVHDLVDDAQLPVIILP